jgi:hypothetical protein
LRSVHSDAVPENACVGGGAEREHSIAVRIECGSRWWVPHALVVATVGAVAITITNRSTVCE